MSILLECAITHQSHVQGTVLEPCPRLNVQLNHSTHPNHDSHSFFSAIVYSDDYLSHEAFVVFVAQENTPLLPPLLATLKRMKLPPRKKTERLPERSSPNCDRVAEETKEGWASQVSDKTTHGKRTGWVVYSLNVFTVLNFLIIFRETSC